MMKHPQTRAERRANKQLVRQRWARIVRGWQWCIKDIKEHFIVTNAENRRYCSCSFCSEYRPKHFKVKLEDEKDLREGGRRHEASL